MKQNIILELDSYFIDKVVNWLSETEFFKKYKIYVITKTKKHEFYKQKLAQFTDLECITYDGVFAYESKEKLDIEVYHSFINNYVNDHITARLFDRTTYFPKYGIGVNNAFCHYTFAAYNVLSFLRDKKIDFVCFRNTPHLITEWLLVKSIDHLGIDFFAFDDFIFPWLFTVKKGYTRDSNLVFKDLSFYHKEELREHITNCVNKISGDYEDAIPTSEKNRFGKGIFKFYNPFQNMLQYFLRPHRSIRPHRFINRTRTFFYYKKHSKQFDLQNTDYVVFFLHYQPEKTTLPDGYEFADQFYAIKILSMMLPKHIKLLVKEHPSMFTIVSEPKFRSLQNYRLILELDNVELVSMHSDNFELIDNSMALATIRGTAALEAYIRKKPVINFGTSNLNLKGVHIFKTIDELQKFVAQVINKAISIENVVDNLTNLCHKTSASGLTVAPEDVKDYSFNREVRENASFKLLTKLLDHKLN